MVVISHATLLTFGCGHALLVQLPSMESYYEPYWLAVQVMGPGCKIYALKRIKLAGRDEEAASGFIDEINLLNSLKNKPNIIQLVESQVR